MTTRAYSFRFDSPYTRVLKCPQSTNSSETEASARRLRRQGMTRCGRLLSTLYSSRKETLLPAFLRLSHIGNFTWDSLGAHAWESTEQFEFLDIFRMFIQLPRCGSAAHVAERNASAAPGLCFFNRIHLFDARF